MDYISTRVYFETGLLSPSHAAMASDLDAVWAAWIPAIESNTCVCVCECVCVCA